MTSRPSSRRGLEDDDDDDFKPQAPERDQELKKISAGSPEFVPDMAAPAKENIEQIDMEANKAAARTSAAASSLGATVLAGQEQLHTEGSLGTYPDAPSTNTTSVLGVATVTSTSMSNSSGIARASKARALEEEKSEDHPETRVGAVAVPGLLARNASHESASTYGTNDEGLSEGLPQAIDEDKPLEAILVANRVEEEVDVEAQVQARVRSEAEEIADMVHRRMLQNAAIAEPYTGEETTSSGTKSEGDNRRKKICILLAVALVIAGAIAAGVAVPLSKSSEPPPQPPDPLDAFRSILVSVSEEGLDNPDSPQFKALNWIANKDPADMTVGVEADETIKQRYVAAVLYFALNGENWNNQYNFLTRGSICSWNQDSFGILCNSTKVEVVAFNICKSNRLRGITISTKS